MALEDLQRIRPNARPFASIPTKADHYLHFLRFEGVASEALVGRGVHSVGFSAGVLRRIVQGHVCHPSQGIYLVL